MNPETPILMITLVMPMSAEFDAAQVGEAIGQHIGQALEEIKRRQGMASDEEMEFDDPEAIADAAFRESLPKETHESYTEDTRPNLLAQMGYAGAE